MSLSFSDFYAECPDHDPICLFYLAGFVAPILGLVEFNKLFNKHNVRNKAAQIDGRSWWGPNWTGDEILQTIREFIAQFINVFVYEEPNEKGEYYISHHAYDWRKDSERCYYQDTGKQDLSKKQRDRLHEIHFIVPLEKGAYFYVNHVLYEQNNAEVIITNGTHRTVTPFGVGVNPLDENDTACYTEATFDPSDLHYFHDDPIGCLDGAAFLEVDFQEDSLDAFVAGLSRRSGPGPRDEPEGAVGGAPPTADGAGKEIETIPTSYIRGPVHFAVPPAVRPRSPRYKRYIGKDGRPYAGNSHLLLQPAFQDVQRQTQTQTIKSADQLRANAIRSAFIPKFQSYAEERANSAAQPGQGGPRQAGTKNSLHS